MTAAEVETGLVSREEGPVLVVTLDATSLDYRNTEAYKAALADLLNENHRQLLFNLENVSFMDSSGLGVLLYARRAMEAQKGKLAACNVKGYVTNLFKLTSLDKVITLYPNEELALLGAQKELSSV